MSAASAGTHIGDAMDTDQDHSPVAVLLSPVAAAAAAAAPPPSTGPSPATAAAQAAATAPTTSSAEADNPFHPFASEAQLAGWVLFHGGANKKTLARRLAKEIHGRQFLRSLTEVDCAALLKQYRKVLRTVENMYPLIQPHVYIPSGSLSQKSKKLSWVRLWVTRQLLFDPESLHLPARPLRADQGVVRERCAAQQHAFCAK